MGAKEGAKDAGDRLNWHLTSQRHTTSKPHGPSAFFSFAVVNLSNPPCFQRLRKTNSKHGYLSDEEYSIETGSHKRNCRICEEEAKRILSRHHVCAYGKCANNDQLSDLSRTHYRPTLFLLFLMCENDLKLKAQSTSTSPSAYYKRRVHYTKEP
jgi:hypothetical protein